MGGFWILERTATLEQNPIFVSTLHVFACHIATRLNTTEKQGTDWPHSHSPLHSYHIWSSGSIWEDDRTCTSHTTSSSPAYHWHLSAYRVAFWSHLPHLFVLRKAEGGESHEGQCSRMGWVTQSSCKVSGWRRVWLHTTSWDLNIYE